MKGGLVRQVVLVSAVLFLVFVQIGLLQAAESTKTGVVLESGYSGVVLKSPGDSGVKYNTGRETRYTPADYRPVKGDKITVEFYPKQLANGQEILAVSALTLVKMDPNRKELTSPAVGTIMEVGRRSIRIDFPEVGQNISMDKKRGMTVVPGGWQPAAGDKVRVTYDKVRARFTSGMVYVMSKMEKMD